MSNQNNDISVFFDSMGRTIIGVVTGDTPTHITVRNPAILHAGLTNEGKIQVNLIPAFFREFLSDWNSPIAFDYNINNIIRDTSGIQLDSSLVKQYEAMWCKRPPREDVRKIAREVVPADTEVKSVERLNLFEDVKTETEKK